MYTGLVDQAFAGTAPSSATYGWNFGSNNGLTNSHARVNIYGTSCYKWLVTPTIDLTNATSAQLSFDLAFTAYSGSNPANVSNVADDKFMVIISTDNGQTWSAANATKWMIADSVTAGVADYDLTALPYSSFQNFVINLNAYLGDSIKIAFYGESTVSGGDNNLHIDNVLVEEIPACPPVTGLVVSNVTSNGATISWIGDADGYTIYDMSDTTVYEYATDTTADLYALDPNTQYTFGVAANCGSDESALRTVSFRTSCAPYSLPFSENFNASLTDDPCWRGADVLYAENTSVNMTNNNVWIHTSSTSNGIEAGHYRVNIYGSSCTKWIITPEIDLGSASSPLLSFDAVFTAYSGTGAASGFENNSSQAFKVLVTTDGGQSWSVASNISLSGIAGTTYVPQYVDLSNYAGDTVRVAFYAQSTQSGGDNNLHIDNILIEESTGSICYPASNLTVSDVTTDGATLNWEGTASSYNVYVITATDTTFAENVSDTTVTLTNLNPMTDYTYGVTADCGDNESIITSISFTTSCTAIELPYTETFESTSGTRSCWTIVGDNANMGGSNGAGFVTLNGRETMRFSSYSNASNYDQYGYSPTLDVDASATNLSVSVVYATYGSNDNLYFGYITATDTIWDPTAYTTSGQNDWQSQTFVIPATATQLAVHYYGNYSYYAWVDSVVVTAMEGDYCAPVAALTVDSASTTSVSLSWTGTANSYSVINMTTGASVATTTDNYVTINGLTEATNYTFGVVADCGTSTSDTVSIAARTACTNSCTLTINATDAYYDGWDGSYINVIQDGTSIAQLTVNGSSETFNVTVCSGTPVTFTWVNMGGDYDEDVAFTILDGAGVQAFTTDDVTGYTSGAVFFTLTDACPSCLPPAVTLGATTTTTATISWTSNATSFDVYNGQTLVQAGVTANNYTFTGLTAGTSYTFGVIAICSSEDSSSMGTVVAMTECGNVTTLPYAEGFENGLGCWTTVNGSADGFPWSSIINNANIAAHSGLGMAASVSYNSGAVHANAWLVSPQIVLPTTTDSLKLSWWFRVNGSYPEDKYEVRISTTTSDTASFTTQLFNILPTAANDDWTREVVDLTNYAGQSVYIAFHHYDSYDADFLAIDDIEIFQGAYVAPDPDTLTVTFAVNDATMGTTNPAPGTYQYLSGDTVFFSAIANSGYHFVGWEMIVSGEDPDTLSDQYVSAYIPADLLMNYGSMTLTALFEAGNPDSTTITYAVNDATMGTTNPAPGTYTTYVGSMIQAEAIANTGYELSAWVLGILMNGSVVQADTIYTNDEEFSNPISFGTLPQDIVDYGASLAITAIFQVSSEQPTQYTVTLMTSDSEMGDVIPGGSTTVAAGETFTAIAVAEDGYHFVQWVVDDGSVVTTNPYSFNVTRDITLMAVFAEGAVEEPFTLVTAVNDATMGTMTPAPGTHTYNAGDVINFTVTPNERYHFVSVDITISMMGFTMFDTTFTDLSFTTESLEVDEEMLGLTMTVTVNFAANVGIEDVEEVNVYAYSKDGQVVLNGAEGREVYLFDINGRMLHHTLSANTTEVYAVPANGVYLVKVAGVETKRVVVIR